MMRMEAEGVFHLLEELARKMEDAAPVMADLADEMAAIVEANFTAGGRPKWAPLSEVTKRLRAKAGTWPGQILIASGGLKNSIEPSHTKDKAEVFTTKEYAPTMQFGARKGQFGTRTITQQVGQYMRQGVAVRAHTRTREQALPWGDIPARPFMVIPESEVPRLADVVRKYLES